MKKYKLEEITDEMIEKAILIYLQTTFEEVSPGEISQMQRHIEFMKQEGEEGIRFGVKGWAHAKLKIGKNEKGYGFWIFDNCVGSKISGFEKKIEEECFKIMEALIEVELPVIIWDSEFGDRFKKWMGRAKKGSKK